MLSQKLVANQKEALQNQPIMFVPEQNLQTNTPDLRIDPEKMRRVLLEFAEVRKTFEEKVPLNVSEEDFWVEFLKKNNRHQTVIFGGIHPVFVPFSTDEKAYIDKKNNAYHGNKER